MFCASPQFKISHAYHYGSLGHNNDRVGLQRLISLNTSVLCRTLNKLQRKLQDTQNLSIMIGKTLVLTELITLYITKVHNHLQIVALYYI